MAVQKSKVTRSRRGMRRSHDAHKELTLSEDSISGEKHLRHHMGPGGVYRGRVLVQPPTKKEAEDAEDGAAG